MKIFKLHRSFKNCKSVFKGAISFIPVGWLAIITGIVGLVGILIVNPVVSVEAGNQITGIGFLLITIWSVSVGLKIAKD